MATPSGKPACKFSRDNLVNKEILTAQLRLVLKDSLGPTVSPRAKTL